MVGMICPGSGSRRAAAASNIAKSILKTLCDQSGLVCSDGDKVVVTQICGTKTSVDARYSSSARRLQSTSTSDNIVQFTFYSTNLDKDVLVAVEALLSTYLQGSLSSFLDALYADIMANNPSLPLHTLTAVTYEAVNAYIAGMGLFYPAWGNIETCLSDGGQEPYMNLNGWLSDTLDACCQRHYGWDVQGCRQRNAEATLISGSQNLIDPTSDLFYPDWGNSNGCKNDGNAPPYIKKQSALWMYANLADCCR